MELHAEVGHVKPGLGDAAGVKVAVEGQPGKTFAISYGNTAGACNFSPDSIQTSICERAAAWRSSSTTSATITLTSTTTLTSAGRARRGPRAPTRRRRPPVAVGTAAPAGQWRPGDPTAPADLRPAGVDEHAGQGAWLNLQLVGLPSQRRVIGLIEADSDGLRSYPQRVGAARP